MPPIQITGTLFNHSIPAIIHSERAGIRTPDNLIKSQVLYQLSYLGISFMNLFISLKQNEKRHKKIAGAGFEPTTFGLWARRASRLLHPAVLFTYSIIYNKCEKYNTYLMDGGGFEPPKRVATDLQSAPFGHSGTHPYEIGFHLSRWSDSNR